MSTVAHHPHRLRAARRDGAQVSPLELFFDLVFVLAITQCTGLMADRHNWEGVEQGLLVLAVLWWTWVGYAWLTSVVDPDAGLVRLVMFAAMAALLVVALCVPSVFTDLGLTFAIAYGFVRAAHIALFTIASSGDPGLHRSVVGLAVSTALGVGLIVAAAFADGFVQGALWIAALALDMGGPYLFGSSGWHLEPAHFVERHGLFVIIALGESIVVLGIGSEVGVTGGVIAAAIMGVLLAAGMWWTYFDVGALLVGRRLEESPPGREQNEFARDAYSYLHFPIVAGVVLVALGFEHALEHVTEPLGNLWAVAITAGLCLFLVGQVLFKIRGMGTFSVPRSIAVTVLAIFVPFATMVDAWAVIGFELIVVWGLILYETFHYAELRAEIRANHHAQPAPTG